MPDDMDISAPEPSVVHGGVFGRLCAAHPRLPPSCATTGTVRGIRPCWSQVCEVVPTPPPQIANTHLRLSCRPTSGMLRWGRSSVHRGPRFSQRDMPLIRGRSLRRSSMVNVTWSNLRQRLHPPRPIDGIHMPAHPRVRSRRDLLRWPRSHERRAAVRHSRQCAALRATPTTRTALGGLMR